MGIIESNAATSEFYRVNGREDARPVCGYDFDHLPEPGAVSGWDCAYCHAELTGPDHLED